MTQRKAGAPEQQTSAGEDGTSPKDCSMGSIELDRDSCDFYRAAMRILQGANVPFLVGGAYALQRYTGISRHTKDFDMFILEADLGRAMQAFDAAGYKTELSFPHWLAKAFSDDLFIDIIFASGNRVGEVDRTWFDNAVEDTVLGMPVRLCPPEEVIWPKAFIMERERYDGADIAHLFRSCAPDLDWQRLLTRFGEHWRLLLNHLVLFGFVYPGERDKVPEWVMRELISRLNAELGAEPPNSKLCRGTLISREQYLIDVHEWGYQDARQEPWGKMSKQEIEDWTEAIEESK